MARLTLGQKAERVLKLLLGLRNPQIAQALSLHGFQQTDLDEGWGLLRAVSNTRLSAPIVASGDPEALASLDAWENRWFPIADATLKRHFPEVHAHVFQNLAQTEGAEVVVSVSTFLERIANLPRNTALGTDGKKAKELLEQRGLKPTVLRIAKELLDRLGTVETSDASVDPEAQEAKILEAEEALWTWYLEWSQIARVAISRRSLLRQLGFLTGPGGRGTSSDKLEPEDSEDLDEDVSGGMDGAMSTGADARDSGDPLPA